MVKKLLFILLMIAPLIGVASCSASDGAAAGSSGEQASSQPSGQPSGQASAQQPSDGSGSKQAPPGQPSDQAPSGQPSSPTDPAGQPSDADPSGARGAASQPDLSDIPDVVADVNGHQITKDQFVAAYRQEYQGMLARAQQTGQQPDPQQLKKQVADTLVNRELMVEKADEQGLTASDQQVDDELAKIVQQNGMDSKADLFAALKKQGTDKSAALAQVKIRVKLDQLVSEQAGDITPTDKELHAFYDQLAQQQKQAGGGTGSGDIPPFEDVKPQLTQQLEQRKQSAAAQQLVTALRKNADVQVNL